MLVTHIIEPVCRVEDTQVRFTENFLDQMLFYHKSSVLFTYKCVPVVMV